MIKKVNIKNFKSIVDETIDLSTLNVFIGANGAGKSNILESLGFIAAQSGSEISLNNLVSAGIRVARPDLMVNSFYEKIQRKSIEVTISSESVVCKKTITLQDASFAYSPWTVSTVMKSLEGQQENGLDDINTDISKFEIYTPEIDALRGLTQYSQRFPIGLHGEGFDVILNSLSGNQKAEAAYMAQRYIDWLDHTAYADDDVAKSGFLKLGRSKSHLYFSDKYMQRKNSYFSAENANEGALVVLFYLTLIMSDKTPRVFAIDNFDMRLNPRLCRYLIGTIYEYAKQYGKQVLVTTHNPAVLDGLNLNDDGQLLYVVKRNDNGNTKIERIKGKPGTERKTKLSELWINGIIGGVPSNF